MNLTEEMWMMHSASLENAGERGRAVFDGDFHEAIQETVERCARIVQEYCGYGPAAIEAARVIRNLTRKGEKQ